MEPWNLDWLSHHIGNGMSSSQLTKSIIFQRGRSTTNQIFFAEFLLRFHVFSKFGTLGGWPSFRVKGATDVNIPSRLGDRMGEKLLAASISWYFMIFHDISVFFGHSPIHFGDTMSYCNWNPNVILFGYTHLFFFLVLELQPRPSRSLSYIPSISHSSVPLLDSSPFSRGLPCPDAWAYIGHQLACLAHARMHCS